MIVVADTGPIRYLVEIGAVEVLPQLFGEVFIPLAVARELSARGAPEEVQQLIARAPEWLQVVTARADILATVSVEVDAGEREAIAYCLQVGQPLFLTDDQKGRREAVRFGLETAGTLGVIASAGKAGLLDVAEAIERLRKTNIYLSEKLIQQVLRAAESER